MVSFTWNSLLTATLLAWSVAAVPHIPFAMQRARIQDRKAMASSLNTVQFDSSYSAPCGNSAPASIHAPKTNIWADLTKDETVSVVAWLFDQKDLNLTVASKAGSWDNTLVLVELMQPNKTDALSYIDGKGKAPVRQVHASISHAASTKPYYQDILITLPIVKGKTRWEPLDYPYTRKTKGRVQKLDADEELLFKGWIWKITASIKDITIDLWNGTSLGLANDTLAIGGIDPLYQEPDGRILRWDGFFSLPTSIFDSSSMMPMGLYFKSDVTGRDASKWKFEGWYYNGIFYKTTKDFRSAYWGGKIQKLPGNWDGPWAHTDRQGPIAQFDTRSPPEYLAIGGSRYSVDSGNKYVEWMDWSLYLGFNYDTGMTLHNIKYKGQRIMYELSLQEALAHYAGSDPLQSHTAYLDSVYGFAPYAFELVKGYDCPAHATYLNSSYYTTEQTHTHVDSICLFEVDADFPLSRHTAPNYVAATKNVKFVIRAIYTIGNYDYMFSYSFLRDGTMAVDVQASGYIQAAFYAQNQDYGFHIHDQLSGSLHDHVLNFKADLDILGTSNTVQFINQVPFQTTYPWSNGEVVNTMKIEKPYLENENDGRFNWFPDSRTQVLIVNQDKPNKFGEKRGYRMVPSTSGGRRLTAEKSTVIKQSANWAYQDIMVSKQKDTEPRSAHRFNSMDTANPPINFFDFFDGESLNQQDLVVWFNLGMHHIPHTGDLPNTVFTTAHSGMQFTPSNYFEIGTNVETVNMVRIDYTEDKGATDVKHFGSFDNTCSLTYEPSIPELQEYLGDIVVRKFPYAGTPTHE